MSRPSSALALALALACASSAAAQDDAPDDGARSEAPSSDAAQVAPDDRTPRAEIAVVEPEAPDEAEVEAGVERDDGPVEGRASGSPFDAESYVALSADQDAQESLGGFRSYLERTRDDDPQLYRVLDARLDELESRDTAADAVFWTATGLSVAALVGAIPVHEYVGLDESIAMIAAGGGTFLLGVIIQAVIRPGHGDLVALIDLHDQRLGRR